MQTYGVKALHKNLNAYIWYTLAYMFEMLIIFMAAIAFDFTFF